MRADKLSLSFALLLLAFQSHVVAATEPKDEDQTYLQPVISSGVATLGSIEKMQGENMLLEMKVKSAQLKRQLKENGLNPDGTDIKVVPVPKDDVGVAEVPKEAKKSETIMPQLSEISGHGKKLVALLTYPNGKQFEVSAGQRLPGSALTVLNISETKVTLSDGSFMGL